MANAVSFTNPQSSVAGCHPSYDNIPIGMVSVNPVLAPVWSRILVSSISIVKNLELTKFMAVGRLLS